MSYIKTNKLIKIQDKILILKGKLIFKIPEGEVRGKKKKPPKKRPASAQVLSRKLVKKRDLFRIQPFFAITSRTNNCWV